MPITKKITEELSALRPGSNGFSLEFFPPKTQAVSQMDSQLLSHERLVFIEQVVTPPVPWKGERCQDGMSTPRPGERRDLPVGAACRLKGWPIHDGFHERPSRRSVGREGRRCFVCVSSSADADAICPRPQFGPKTIPLHAPPPSSTIGFV